MALFVSVSDVKMVKSDVLCLICVKFREIYLPPDGFFGFRISLNSISAGAPVLQPQTRLGERSTLSPFPTPLDAFRVSMSMPSASRLGT